MSPLKIFEYMAAERPIVCSDLPALREILEDDVTAVFRPPGDVHAWSSALRALRDSPDVRDRLAKRAFDCFLREYTWDARVERIMQGLSG